MTRLRLLGAIELKCDGADPRDILAQPKRTALLSHLVLAGRSGSVRRDTLLALLWPDLDASHARNALSQTLHQIRRVLPEDPIPSEGRERISVDVTQLQCDAVDFWDAFETGGFEDALNLYRGELLPGFHLSRAPEFEKWLDIQRKKCRDAAATSAERVVEQRLAAGDHAGAILTARTALLVDPDDERATRRLMSILADGGDRRGALSAYDELKTRMQAEFDVLPSPDTQALAEQIRAQTAATVAVPNVSLVTESAPAPPAANDSAAPARRRPSNSILLAGLFAAVVVTAGVRFLATTAQESVDTIDERLVVMPFTVRGDDELGFLSDGMVSLLGARLDGSGSLRGVDPRAVLATLPAAGGRPPGPDQARATAARFGAGHFLLGDVVSVGTQLEITASLYQVDQRDAVFTTHVSGSAEAVVDLVDELAAELLTSVEGEDGSRTVDLGDLTTVDLDALKAYLEGERRIRSGQFGGATEVLQDAVAIDSTFALAHYLLAIASHWADQREVSLVALTAANEMRSRLSARAAALLDALSFYLDERYLRAEAAYREFLSRYPHQLEAWYMLGETIFHGGHSAGWSPEEALPMFERVLAVNPESSDALLHVTRIAARYGSDAEFEAFAQRFLDVSGDSDRALEVLTLMAFREGDPAAIRRALDQLRQADGLVIALSAIALASFEHDLPGARTVTQLLLDRSNDPYKAWAGRMTIRLALAQGRLRDAVAMSRVQNFSNGPYAVAGWIAATGVEPTVEPAMRQTIERMRDTTDADDPGAIEYVHGLLDIAVGDLEAAQTRLESLGSNSGAYRDLLGAWLAQASDRPQDVEKHLKAALNSGPAPVPEFSPGQAERLLYATALAATGNETDALRRFSGFGNQTGYDVMFLAPAHLRAARLAEASGDHELSREHYARVRSLWADADREVLELMHDALPTSNPPPNRGAR